MNNLDFILLDRFQGEDRILDHLVQEVEVFIVLVIHIDLKDIVEVHQDITYYLGNI